MANSHPVTQKLDFVSQKNMAECQTHLRNIIASRPFLNNEGLNNEVPFHICPYDPAIAADMYQLIRQLKNELAKEGKSVLEINIYDLAVDLLKEQGDWDWLLENEASLSRGEFKEELQGVLDVETVLVPSMASRMEAAPFDVMFISGVGEVFPYIRSHSILNNLQKVAKKQPTLMFFPGEYKHSLVGGAQLVLFGLLKNDRYYRAFNILDRAS